MKYVRRKKNMDCLGVVANRHDTWRRKHNNKPTVMRRGVSIDTTKCM